jgi:hypothetical protein
MPLFFIVGRRIGELLVVGGTIAADAVFGLIAVQADPLAPVRS